MPSIKMKFFDTMENKMQKITGPMARFSNLKVVQAIVNGLMGTMPIILSGAFFMILYVLGSPSIGTSGKALIPFLTPLASNFYG
ncbi:cellobiose-specific phosphotransferase system component IIC [Lactobacillus colini]|uniref:Cellobiose-specific phosphotransferase system component IIC n=1 Tax=Lactobacillus colini TaxID=1819254 RepID=A0ABS4MG61_9LACO|nr:hypothetical protein [Lactobacillus colini]MBP2058677.1 cellobiose-specific phosphotransferase system component IIC [Lactobacillus colini]